MEKIVKYQIIFHTTVIYNCEFLNMRVNNLKNKKKTLIMRNMI